MLTRWGLTAVLSAGCALALSRQSQLGALQSGADLTQQPFVLGSTSPRIPSDKRSSTGLTDAVEWDGYSLFVKGQRLFVW